MAEPIELPQELQAEENPYGFVGRDGALLQLERALHRKPPVLLIHGLGGVGKTTLAGGFVEWLLRTKGLTLETLFWFRFDEIHSAEYVLNRIGERCFGPQFGAMPQEKKLEKLLKKLPELPLLLVWDNFEVVHGIADTSVNAKLPPADRDLLTRLVQGLDGGKTKILLTSRSDESWLGKPYRYRLELAGLDGEERWEFCETILERQGVTVNRKDPELSQLLDLLDGHPLAMRVILPELETRSAQAVRTAVEKNVGTFETSAQNATEAKLFATLRFATEQLPDALQPLLVPLALHQRYVDGNLLDAMAQTVDADQWSQTKIDTFLTALGSAGLLRDVGQSIYELHPLLTRYLRSCVEDEDSWTRAFVDVFGSLANALSPRPLHEQRAGFHMHGENFHTARREAARLKMDTDYAALTQSLAVYAQNTRGFAAAERLYDELRQHHHDRGDEQSEAAACHQLGRIAEEQRDFVAAETWYRKSLEIKERLGNEDGAASTYGQLGILASLQQRFADAAGWYVKCI